MDNQNLDNINLEKIIAETVVKSFGSIYNSAKKRSRV